MYLPDMLNPQKTFCAYQIPYPYDVRVGLILRMESVKRTQLSSVDSQLTFAQWSSDYPLHNVPCNEIFYPDNAHTHLVIGRGVRQRHSEERTVLNPAQKGLALQVFVVV